MFQQEPPFLSFHPLTIHQLPESNLHQLMTLDRSHCNADHRCLQTAHHCPATDGLESFPPSLALHGTKILPQPPAAHAISAGTIEILPPDAAPLCCADVHFGCSRNKRDQPDLQLLLDFLIELKAEQTPSRGFREPTRKRSNEYPHLRYLFHQTVL